MDRRNVILIGAGDHTIHLRALHLALLEEAELLLVSLAEAVKETEQTYSIRAQDLLTYPEIEACTYKPWILHDPIEYPRPVNDPKPDNIMAQVIRERTLNLVALRPNK